MCVGIVVVYNPDRVLRERRYNTAGGAKSTLVGRAEGVVRMLIE